MKYGAYFCLTVGVLNVALSAGQIATGREGYIVGLLIGGANIIAGRLLLAKIGGAA